jgi:hypothetical protein
MAELLARRTDYVRGLIKPSIFRRWGAPDYDILFPWWGPPPKVRILMYADGREVRFSGSPFGGLQHVITLLESRINFYVDFEITTAHREGDESATIKEAKLLTDPELDILNNYDQVWFFGIREQPGLTKEERDLLDTFMGSPEQGYKDGVLGGVLVTGDHGDLGKAIAGDITRAGEMRRYPAPGSGPKVANSTLEEGPDPLPIFSDSDQWDDLPQKVRYTRFPVGSPVGFRRRVRPHPVLCGPDGPIDVFPDHRHEGEALAPAVRPEDVKTWPIKDKHQELPCVIAKGLIKDPEVTCHGSEIGLVSAYNGHNVDVGRIIADSSWHHWFDFNLLGVRRPPSPYAGFDATPGGQAALKSIEAYFLNCAVWLSPPRIQAQIRNAVWWSIVWTDPIVELPPDAPLWYFGEQAIAALKLHLPTGAVIDYILDTPAFRAELPHGKLPEVYERLPLFNLALEHYVAGGILRELMQTVGPFNRKLRFPDGQPSDEALGGAINTGTKLGVSAVKEQLKEDARLLLNLIDSNFRMELPPQ